MIMFRQSNIHNIFSSLVVYEIGSRCIQGFRLNHDGAFLITELKKSIRTHLIFSVSFDPSSTENVLLH